ncbi:anthrone oxygenase family protein [Nocardioides sp. CER19]|uniref:anthrone oxygenase family protein n=1 Tax=Nocardioides sp. CER19 TaxID=3038538 RepID=UPI002448B3C9|nr:anthrone oxygenase family protein [Nocardioides sp. CER19]MDH2416078.1 DUF1772 domain-containing protein [Nocardioides sp. CER19]
MTIRTLVPLLATVAAGLQAGTYYVWACGVMPGMARTDDKTFVSALTHMNQAIVNPVFMATFVGTPLLAAAAVATGPNRPWLAAGLGLAVLTVVITGAANVPLNDALDQAAAHPAAAREAFESTWVRWNVARTVTSTGALAALAWAALRAA